MLNTAMIEVYYKLVKANSKDAAIGRKIDQVPESLRDQVQEKLNNDMKSE